MLLKLHMLAGNIYAPGGTVGMLKSALLPRKVQLLGQEIV